MSALTVPSGDVTLLFTDIEGSTRKWDRYLERFHEALRLHNELLRSAIAAWSGYEVKTIGDGFMIAFSDPVSAALCALDIERKIEAEAFEEVGGLRVRIGMHTGDLEPLGGDYFGNPVNRAARVANAGHGGMILLSEDTAQRVADALPPDVKLIDLGLHRLKDLGSPQRLFRLSHPDLPNRPYPQLRTLEAIPQNFPAQVTSFVGRGRELRELGELVYLKGARLLTLTGPGGTGKTRLAMQVAADHLQHYPGGVWLVELAHVTDAREVPSAIALALGVPLQSENSDVRTQVFEFLRDRKVMLVLDNFEQVIEAARFVSELLRECSNVVCLITSRQLLQISGEREYTVEPLELPPREVSAATYLNYECMQLFVERSLTARPNFALTDEVIPTIADICRRLEGIPLAVELTATLVRGMTPQQILPRLDNRFRLLETTRRDLEPRQRSLRGSIDSSYELLTEDERALFAELAIFAGGFFIEDAEAICTAPDTLMTVFGLRDKSLLKADTVLGETRYSMLETLREYALEKLQAQGELPGLRERHTRHYQQKAELLAEELTSGDTLEALQRLTVDIDNMRAGMAWAEAQQDAALITGYSAPLSRYFQRRGLYEDAARWLKLAEETERRLASEESAEAAQREDSHTRRLADILLQRGLMHYRRSECARAVDYFSECLPIFRQVGDWRHVASSLTNLGNCAWAISRYGEARTRWEEALTLTREYRLSRFEGDLLPNLAFLAHQQGEALQARDYSEQAIALLRRANDSEGLAYALLNFGDLLLEQSEDCEEENPNEAEMLRKRARKLLEEANQLFQAMGISEGIGQTTERLGLSALLEGDTKTAGERCRHALTLSERNNDRRCQLYAQRDSGRIALIEAAAASTSEGRNAQFQTAARHLRAALALAETLEDAAEVAFVVWRAGEFAEQKGNTETAFLAVAVALRELERLQLHVPNKLLAGHVRLQAALSEETRQRLSAQVAQGTPRSTAEAALL